MLPVHSRRNSELQQIDTNDMSIFSKDIHVQSWDPIRFTFKNLLNVEKQKVSLGKIFIPTSATGTLLISTLAMPFFITTLEGRGSVDKTSYVFSFFAGAIVISIVVGIISSISVGCVTARRRNLVLVHQRYLVKYQQKVRPVDSRDHLAPVLQYNKHVYQHVLELFFKQIRNYDYFGVREVRGELIRLDVLPVYWGPVAAALPIATISILAFAMYLTNTDLLQGITALTALINVYFPVIFACCQRHLLIKQKLLEKMRNRARSEKEYIRDLRKSCKMDVMDKYCEAKTQVETESTVQATTLTIVGNQKKQFFREKQRIIDRSVDDFLNKKNRSTVAFNNEVNSSEFHKYALTETERQLTVITPAMEKLIENKARCIRSLRNFSRVFEDKEIRQCIERYISSLKELP